MRAYWRGYVARYARESVCVRVYAHAPVCKRRDVMATRRHILPTTNNRQRPTSPTPARARAFTPRGKIRAGAFYDCPLRARHVRGYLLVARYATRAKTRTMPRSRRISLPIVTHPLARCFRPLELLTARNTRCFQPLYRRLCRASPVYLVFFRANFSLFTSLIHM